MKRILLILPLLLLASSSLTFAETKPEQDIDFVLQDESKPVRSVFLSEPTQNDGQPESIDRFAATIKIAKAILPALREGQKLVYVGSEKSYVRLTKELSDTKLFHVVSQPYMWLQDLIEFGETKNGFVGILSAANRAAAFPAIATMQSIVPNTLTLKVLNMHGGVFGSIGGNFELWPGGIGIIGTSDFASPSSLASFSKQIFPEATAVLGLPTSWLHIGHVDEVVKMLTYTPGDKCEIRVLINNPDLALRLLSADGAAAFLDELEDRGNRVGQIESISQFCKSEGLSCKDLRNRHVFDAYTRNPKLKTALSLTQAQVDEIKRVVNDTYEKRLPACAVKWIEAPALYLNQLENGRLKPQSGVSMFPSLTNGILINDTYVVADPGNPTFRRVFTKALGEARLKVAYVPLGKELYEGKPTDGYIHCMTQVLREPGGK